MYRDLSGEGAQPLCPPYPIYPCLRLNVELILSLCVLYRVKLEERIAEYEQKEEVWRKASAQVEDLKEQLLARYSG